MEFFEDGTFMAIEDGSSTSGEWSRLDDGRVKLRMEMLGTVSMIVFKVEVTEELARFENQADGDIGIYARKAATAEPASDSSTVKFASDGERQAYSMKALRDVGVALMSWLTDEWGAAGAGQPGHPIVSVDEWPTIDAVAVEAVLVPAYLPEMPRIDGWGNPIEFRVRLDDPYAERVMFIRSPGKDGRFSGDRYKPGAFPSNDFDHDIVWADGFFITWPQGETGG